MTSTESAAAPAPPAATAPDLVPRSWRVRSTTAETADTVTIELEPAGGQPVPFRPGQSNMLSRFGLGEVPISISSDPDHPEVHGHTIRAAGAVTTGLVRVVPGDLVGVRGPFGTGWDAEAAVGRNVIVVAGGCGLAPLRPLIYWLLGRRDRIGLIAICYGGRTPADLMYAEQLHGWSARFDLDVRVTVDRPAVSWRGRVGMVPSLLEHLDFDPDRTVGYVCGPEAMMLASADTLTAAGLPAAAIEVSLERNMKCMVGLCGHCQLGPYLLCRDGPVLPWSSVAGWLRVGEV